MKDDLHSRILRSKFIAVAAGANGARVICHISRLYCFACSPDIVSMIQWFRKPRSWEEVYAQFDSNKDQIRNLILSLAEGGIFHRAVFSEEERIKESYSHPFRELDIVTPFELIRFAKAQKGNDHDRLSFSSLPESLVCSKGIASIHLGRMGYLVTHPLGRPLHVDNIIWNVARAFRKAISPEKVWDSKPAWSFQKSEFIAVVSYLVRKNILFLSEDEEKKRVQDEFGSSLDKSFAMIPEVNSHTWELAYKPLQVTDLRPNPRRAVVGVFGACQLYVSLKAFEHLAQRDGWELDIRVFRPMSGTTKRQKYDMVLMSVQSSVVRFLEASVLGKFAVVSSEIPKIVAAYDKALQDIRADTDAPILTHSFGQFAFSPTYSSLRGTQLFRSFLAELNHEIFKVAESDGNTFVLDEDQVVREYGPHFYWDDEFNTSTHHAPVSLWGRHPLVPYRDRPYLPRSKRDRFPPIRDNQTNPAAVFARAYLDALHRIKSDSPIRLIIFEPNELLWQGLLEDRETPCPDDYNPYTSDLEMRYNGVHEVLKTLVDKGVKLACLSSCDASVLKKRWSFRFTSDLTLLPNHLSYLFGGKYRDRYLSDILSQERLKPSEVLYIDFLNRPPAKYEGLVFTGDPWQLRKFLLKYPKLGAETRKEAIKRPGVHQKASKKGSRAGPSIQEPSKIRKNTLEVLCASLKCTSPDIQKAKNLRTLGLSSLGFIEIMTKLESVFDIRFRPEDLIEENLASFEALCRTVSIALSRNLVDGLSTGRSVYRKIPEVKIKTIGAILLEHAKNPQVPWIFKFLRSPSPHDHEYVTWKQLIERASSFTEHYREKGLQPGDLITILLPQGLDLVAAFVGAILGGFTPTISAFPSEKLSVSDFMEWFGVVLVRSQTRLVVSAPVFLEPIRSTLRKQRAHIEVESYFPFRMSRDLGDCPDIATDPLVTAFLQHSSGTTGIKKAVGLSHEIVIRQITELSHRLSLCHDDVIVSWLPLYHDMGLIACLVLPLLTSTPTVMMSPFDWVNNPSMLFDQISTEKGSLCWLPNFAFIHCARRVPEGADARWNLTSLRSVVSCSESITGDAMDMFYNRFSRYGLKYSALSSSYAMAEATFAVTQTAPGRTVRRSLFSRSKFLHEHVAQSVSSGTSDEDSIEFVSSGPPLSETTVDIVDERKSVLGEGCVGEIRLSAPWLMKGYFRDAETTREVMADGWYYTGDLGFVHDGHVYVTGRKKDMIIVAGQNVYPHFVEEAISSIEDVYPGRVSAIGIYNEELGTEDLVILAELKRYQAVEGDADEVSRLKERIHRLVLGKWMISIADIRFFPYQTLIKSTSGKLSRGKNREMYIKLET